MKPLAVAVVATAVACAVAAPAIAKPHRHARVSTVKKPAAKRGPAGPRGPVGPRGPAGPAGATGGQGATGATGPAGSFSAANVTTVQGAPVTLCASGAGSCDVGVSAASCPAGSAVIGGGFSSITNPLVNATLSIDGPLGNAWEVGVVNNAAIGATFYAIAICAT